jgi:hypothetical protein
MLWKAASSKTQRHGAAETNRYYIREQVKQQINFAPFRSEFSHLLLPTYNLMIEIHKNIIWTGLLYGRETWSLSLRE